VKENTPRAGSSPIDGERMGIIVLRGAKKGGKGERERQKEREREKERERVRETGMEKRMVFLTWSVRLKSIFSRQSVARAGS
jgi:hypothetical protein